MLKPAELASVCREVSGALLGGRAVQRVVQPDRDTVLLGFQGVWLLLCVSPRLGRLQLDEKPAGTGDEPPAFCMLLRKELLGARLSACRAVEGERAAELLFERGGVQRRLWLFLFGRSSQLVLVGEQDRVLGACGPARRTHSALPPARVTGGPLSEEDRFGPNPSRRIGAEYREQAEREASGAARQAATSLLRERIERAARLEKALHADRARAETARARRKFGDLLLAHLREVPRGASSVTLADDFEAGAPIEIALDPARSAKENAERFYKEHKRATRGLATIERRLADASRARAAAEAELAAVEAAPQDAEIAAPVKRAQARPARKRAGRLPPYREFRAANGAAILVGRGADRNDELTFQVGRGSDLWLHARDVPGAHVIVPLASGRPGGIDEQTLLDAATLAAHHSTARGAEQVDIGYTLRKNVRKPPRSRPGLVTTSALKTLRVRIEPERLARLLATLVQEK